MSGHFRSWVYDKGELVATGSSLHEACAIRAGHPHGLSVLVLTDPTDDDVAHLADEFGLHPMAVEDAMEPRQRPKFDRYGETAFVALRPARYLDEPETVEVGEIDLFVGADFAVVVTYDGIADLDFLPERLSREPWIPEHGGLGILYAVLDKVVDDYAVVLDGLDNDVEEIEDQVFAGERGAARRIYELAREAIALQRAIHPLPTLLRRAGFAADAHLHEEANRDLQADQLRAGLADVWDHVSTTGDRVDAVRTALSDILQTNATLVGMDQNARSAEIAEAQFAQDQQVKKISSWAAVFLAPTLLAGVWGMNFDVMPELGWRFGYPAALGVMALVSIGLYWRFRRINWL